MTSPLDALADAWGNRRATDITRDDALCRLRRRGRERQIR